MFSLVSLIANFCGEQLKFICIRVHIIRYFLIFVVLSYYLVYIVHFLDYENHTIGSVIKCVVAQLGEYSVWSLCAKPLTSLVTFLVSQRTL